MQKPSIPEGTRDFSPQEVARRSYIFDAIRTVFERYGYQPIETPSFEKLSTLTGKYGDEGDKLLFKILNNGDYLAKADAEALESRNSAKLVSSIAGRGLRYDLTVPFARYVVMRQNEIAFPFKRYQIQLVWRGDSPQRGRYREFTQCDVDVVGSKSLTYEAELIQIYDDVFAKLGIEVEIRVNNRKILEGMAEVAGCHDRLTDLTVAIDKLDKIGIEGVRKELTNRGFSSESIERVEQFLQATDRETLREQLKSSEVGTLGMTELDAVYGYLADNSLQNTLVFDPTLARGLSYYTGFIVEVVATRVKMGSIGGGGRYDDLTGIFGLKNVSGVGISFGADRIYEVVKELDAFPKEALTQLTALVVALDSDAHKYGFGVLTQLRRAGISSDLYPEPAKIGKQMKYADARGTQFTIIIGSNEVETGQLSLKNMATGAQQTLRVSEIIQMLSAGNER